MGTFIQISKDTLAKFTEDAGYPVFMNMKALHNKCSVIRVVPQACLENSAQIMNKVNEIGCKPRKQMTHIKQRKHYSLVTCILMNKVNEIGCEPRKQTTHIKQQKHYWLVTCILADFAVDLWVWLWVYSLNPITILCIKIWKIGFLGKN